VPENTLKIFFSACPNYLPPSVIMYQFINSSIHSFQNVKT
jgi:hypothetical protein